MAGKKRRLKKIAKRKLRKANAHDEKSNEKRKDEENKVPKIDNQTLQQLMMAQMMSSRARSSNGEGAGWISVQNQANADKVQQQQIINTLKNENKKWKKKAEDIEHNEKFREIKEGYEKSIEDNKRKIEELEQLRPLVAQLEQLKKEKQELEEKYNSPVAVKERQISELEAEIELLSKKQDNDPDRRKKIAELNTKISSLKETQRLAGEISDKNKKIKDLDFALQAKIQTLRQNNPSLKGVKWNSTNMDDMLSSLRAALTEEEINLNSAIEKVKSGSREVEVITRTKNNFIQYLNNMVREHPQFYRILQTNVGDINNASGKDIMAGIERSMMDYGRELGLQTVFALEAHAALNHNNDISAAEGRLKGLFDRVRSENSLYDSFNRETGRKLASGFANFVSDEIAGKMRNLDEGIKTEYVRAGFDAISRGDTPVWVRKPQMRWEQTSEYSHPITNMVITADEEIRKTHELDVAAFGPGREGIQTGIPPRPQSVPLTY